MAFGTLDYGRVKTIAFDHDVNAHLLQRERSHSKYRRNLKDSNGPSPSRAVKQLSSF